MRGEDARTVLDALTLLLARDPEFATRLELVVAGPISDSEREVLTRGELRKVVRVLGLLSRARALGLQQAADGLLLIPGGVGATTAKVYEYLAARKPIFAVTEQDGAAAELLRAAGEHTVAEAGDAESLAAALETYVRRWTGASYEPRPDFDLDAYEYENLGQKLLQLLHAGLDSHGQLGPIVRAEETSPLAAVATEAAQRIEYIRLVRPTAFVRACWPSTPASRASPTRSVDSAAPPGFVGSGDFRPPETSFGNSSSTLGGLAR